MIDFGFGEFLHAIRFPRLTRLQFPYRGFRSPHVSLSTLHGFLLLRLFPSNSIQLRDVVVLPTTLSFFPLYDPSRSQGTWSASGHAILTTIASFLGIPFFFRTSPRRDEPPEPIRFILDPPSSPLPLNPSAFSSPTFLECEPPARPTKRPVFHQFSFFCKALRPHGFYVFLPFRLLLVRQFHKLLFVPPTLITSSFAPNFSLPSCVVPLRRNL